MVSRKSEGQWRQKLRQPSTYISFSVNLIWGKHFARGHVSSDILKQLGTPQNLAPPSEIPHLPLKSIQFQIIIDKMTSIKLKTPVTGEYEQPTGLYVQVFI